MSELSQLLPVGAHLLPRNATVPERAAAALGEIVHRLDDPVATMFDPWRCPVEALPFLAWAARVPLWDERWPETKKRAVLAESPELNSVKGTTYAISRYVEIMDGRAVHFMLPPSGIYLEAGPDEAADTIWRERFAEIRIYDRPGADVIAWDFLGEAFAGGEDDAGLFLAPYAPRPKRRAELHDGGAVDELELVETRVHHDGGATRIVETLFGSGVDQGGFYAGEACLGDALLPTSEVLFLTLVDGEAQTRPGIDAVLLSDRPERVVVSGIADDFLLGDGALDIGCLMTSAADRMIYESMRVFDAARSAGVRPAGFCLDDEDLFSLPANHMLVDIDASFPIGFEAAFYDSFESDYLMPDDGAHRRRLFAAAASANPTSDRTLASTALHRPIRFSDGLPFGSFAFGAMINSREFRHHA